MRWRLTPYSTILLLILVPFHALMQNGVCPELVQQALTDIGENCSTLTKNTACYGFNRVEATFDQEVNDDIFSKPADRAELLSMQSIITAPLNEALDQWGVAVLSLQANVPNSLPGQSVRFLMFGDVQMKNDVPADKALAAVDPVPVVTLVGANVRSRPTKNANVVGSVGAGAELAADGISEDGAWVRVVINETSPGWISTQLIDAAADLANLPIITPTSLSPMQAFTFRTGIGQPSCDEAPDVLVVQGPDNVQVSITANGVDIDIGSTIYLKSIADDRIQLGTLNGSAQSGDLIINEGFTATASLDENGQAGAFGGLRPMTQSDLNDLGWLETVPDDILEYAIDVPEPPPPPPTVNPSNPVPIVNQAGSSTGILDCSPFRATSPLDGVHYGLNNFYWDAAPGATSYRLNVPGVGSVEVSASTTNVTFDLSNAGPGSYQISWSVDALVNGVVACSSAYITVPRELATPTAADIPITGSWTCGPGYDNFTMSWNNLPSGTDSLSFYFDDQSGESSPSSSYTISAPPGSGSQTFSGGGYPAEGYIVANPSGTTVFMSPSVIDCRLG
jgi:hypothetical protein